MMMGPQMRGRMPPPGMAGGPPGPGGPRMPGPHMGPPGPPGPPNQGPPGYQHNNWNGPRQNGNICCHVIKNYVLLIMSSVIS